jgi:predicted molibdopterin-dependent oxidoreductase YjgC
MDEIAEMTPRYAGLSHERIGRKGLMWPVDADGTDSPILYEKEFETESGKAHFAALPYKEPGDAVDDDFQLILVTGRRLEHYNAGTMTRRTGNVDLMTGDVLEIHPDDAAPRGLDDGGIATVTSRVGEIKLPVQVTENIEPGHVFTTFHFPEVRTNLLVGQSSDVNTSCPEYKVIAVSVEHDSAADREREPALR